MSGNNLFVANSVPNAGIGTGVGTVGEYNATTGAVINANFITGLSPLPVRLAVASVSGSNVTLANAGPNQTVQVRTLVTLDGSGSSDPTGQLPLTYAWSFVSTPAGSTEGQRR